MSTPHLDQDDIDIVGVAYPLLGIRENVKKIDNELAELVSTEDTVETKRRSQFLM